LRELALHILDIVQNSVSAGAQYIKITAAENLSTDRLFLSVEDNGKGMDEAMVARVVDPFVTSRTSRRVGLGIPLLKAAAEACNGWFKISSTLGKGTLVEVEFQHSHIDRMPLGDMGSTILNLVVSYPEIHWVYDYSVNGRHFEFDSQPIKDELGDEVPFTDPSVLAFLREYISTGIASVQTDTN